MRRLARAALPLVVLALLAPGLAPAQEGTGRDAEDAVFIEPAGDLTDVEPRGLLTAKVGTGSLATLPFDLERLALADESVARPQVISSREILFTGLRPGQTTVHIWLQNGDRLEYLLRIERDLDLLFDTLRELDPRIEIEATPDGRLVVLRGVVDSAAISREAHSRARAFLGEPERALDALGSRELGDDVAPTGFGDRRGATRVLNLLRYPGSGRTSEERLANALRRIDPRIQVRVIQVGPDPNPAADTYVLEGRVRDIPSLVQAITLAERQLGGTGDRISAVQDDRITRDRFQGGFQGGTGLTGVAGLSGGGTAGGTGGRGALQTLGGGDPRASSLATQVARNLIVTSQSGRVVSLLKVDELPQIATSIRVLEIDRAKARRVGVNFRIDAEHVSIGSYLSPGVQTLPAAGTPPSVDDLDVGNIVAAFVDQTAAIVSAVDFLQQRDLARAVAEPNILTLSGETASVLVGGEIPIETAAIGQVAVVQGFFFQEFGVRLDLRPTIDQDGIVALEVAPSIVRPNPGLGTGDVPGFQVQSVQTTARVPAGQSLVIGGLLAFEESLEDRRLPGLGKIPLFRWKRRGRQEQELLFVITPRLVAIGEEVQPPVRPRDPDEIELPELEWPYERRHWRDEFVPQQLRPDGVPPTFFPGEPVDDYDYLPVRYVEPEAEAVVESAADREAAAAPAEAAPPEASPPPAGASPAPPPEASPPAPSGEIGEGPPIEEADLAIEEPADLAEPEPTPAPPLEPAPEQAVVRVTSCLNLRAAPDASSPSLDCLPPGTRVEIVGTGFEWTEVLLADGRMGWVASAYLERVASPEPLDEEEPGLLWPDDEAAAIEDRVGNAESAQAALEERLDELVSELEELDADAADPNVADPDTPDPDTPGQR